MIIRRSAVLLAAIVAAASLGVIAAGAGTAWADPPECEVYTQCDDPNAPLPPGGGGSYEPNPCHGQWQQVYVGSEMQMGSCQLSYDFSTATLSAKTWLLGGSIWGFHGCVKAQFIDAGGVAVHETAEHRWGVDGGDQRTVLWTDTGPNIFGPAWDHVEFVQRRC